MALLAHRRWRSGSLCACLVVWCGLGAIAPLSAQTGPEMAPEQDRLWVSLEERLAASEERTRELEARLDALTAQREFYDSEPPPPVVAAPQVPPPDEDSPEPDPDVRSLLGPERSYRSRETSLKAETEKKDEEKKWYDKIGLRGYGQFRYNRLAESDGTYVSTQGDRSIGDNNSFIIRRARLIFSGDISDHLYIYIQPDFASGVNGPNPLHFAQLRDFYADIAIDEAKEFRFRVGQSKIPFGFEILQSSQNRIALDRNDAMNSAAVNERDLGVFFYYAPEEIRERFRYLVQSGLKGSGDYGVVGLGVYNGQTANRPELNDQLHMIARIAYPFELENGQYFEPFFGGYHGRYDITRSA
ncbi:MAG TPA: porin, partial [Pirellulales bacterium]